MATKDLTDKGVANILIDATNNYKTYIHNEWASTRFMEMQNHCIDVLLERGYNKDSILTLLKEVSDENN